MAGRPPETGNRRRRVERRVERRRWWRGLIRGAGAVPGPVRGEENEGWAQRHWTSRSLHRFGDLTSHAGAGLVIAVAVVGWLVIGLAVSFPDWWQVVLYASSSSVTLVMVFAIQHTQARQQSATQRKLDELLRSLPDADNRVIAAEEAPDDELEALADLNLEDREKAR
jgi:low affinity Fe/Cu permease